MSFVNYQSQIVPGKSNLDISQQNIQRMNDRKDHLVSEFQMYPGNKFQVQFNQLAKYLDKKVNLIIYLRSTNSTIDKFSCNSTKVPKKQME